MNSLVMTGLWESALSHMALFGAAAIIEDRADPRVRVQWGASSEPEPTLVTRLTHFEVAEVVRTHAQGALASWVGATFTHVGAQHGVFSPRLTKPNDRGDWIRLQEARRTWLDSDELGLLDRRMISGLGEMGYWCWRDPKSPDPSLGATAWEMKTRNRGEEFVMNRLALIGRAVQDRNTEQVLRGLFEGETVDEPGKNSSGSRTPTGLTSPRPTDAARAWCALWGFSALTTRPKTRVTVPSFVPNRSTTSGVWMADGRRYFAVPAFHRAALPVRVRGVMRSHALIQSASERLEGAAASGADAWLVSQGVGAVVTFAQYTSNNVNAPEHWLLDGAVWPLLR